MFWGTHDQPLADSLPTLLKTFTGNAPFNLHVSIAVALAIIRGDRPERPVHRELTDGLWQLMQDCWTHDPYSRPNMLEVLDVFHGR